MIPASLHPDAPLYPKWDYGQHGSPMKIAYLVHNLNDPAVERRCVMLERGGAQVLLAGFCRDAVLAAPIAARKPLLLGTSQDAAMLRRAIGTFRSALFNGRVKAFFADCEIVMARNLEQLGIARTFVGDRPLVYECLDIHRLLVGEGRAARAIQGVEAKLLPRVDLLITSSPAFVTNHFASTSLSCPVELVENKLLVKDMNALPEYTQPEWQPTLTIGWFGMLRCEQTLRSLIRLTEIAAGKLKVLIAGKPSPAVFPDFAAAVGGISAIDYIGPYSYDELPSLYGRCHFAWTIDWFEEGENSSWLLPNRIYEALAFGSIPIALADIEVGRWLGSRQAGLLVPRPEDLQAMLLNMAPDQLAIHQRNVRSIPRQDVLADDSDCRALVERLRNVKYR